VIFCEAWQEEQAERRDHFSAFWLLLSHIAVPIFVTHIRLISFGSSIWCVSKNVGKRAWKIKNRSERCPRLLAWPLGGQQLTTRGPFQEWKERQTSELQRFFFVLCVHSAARFLLGWTAVCWNGQRYICVTQSSTFFRDPRFESLGTIVIEIDSRAFSLSVHVMVWQPNIFLI